MAVYSGGSLRNRTDPYWKERQKELRNIEESMLFRLLCFVVFALSVVWLLGYGIYCLRQNMSTRNTQKELQDIREEADMPPQYEMQFDKNGLPVAGVAIFENVPK